MSHVGDTDSCAGCVHTSGSSVPPDSPCLQRKCFSKLLAPSKFLLTPPRGHYFQLCGMCAFSLATGNVCRSVQSEQLKVLFDSIQTRASLCALPEQWSHLVDALSQLKPWTAGPSIDKDINLLLTFSHFNSAWPVFIRHTQKCLSFHKGRNILPLFFVFVTKDNLADSCEHFAVFWENTHTWSYACRQQSAWIALTDSEK